MLLFARAYEYIPSKNVLEVERGKRTEEGKLRIVERALKAEDSGVSSSSCSGGSGSTSC